MSKRAEHTIKRELIEDMKKVFDNDTALFMHLRTNRNTWSNILGDTGVKDGTARSIIKQFFRLTKSIHDGGDSPKDVDGDIAIHIYKKYEDLIVDYNYDQFLTSA